MPSVGEVLWGDVKLFTVPAGTEELVSLAGRTVYMLDYDDGRFTPVADATVRPAEPLPPELVSICPALAEP